MWSERHYVGFLMKHGRKLGHITHDSFFFPPSPSPPDIIVMISFTAHNPRRHRPHQWTVNQTGWQIATPHILFPAYTRQASWKTLSSEMEWERGEPKAIKDSQLKWNSSLKYFKYIKTVKFVTHLAILVWVYWLMPCYCYYTDVKCDIVIVSTVTTLKKSTLKCGW